MAIILIDFDHTITVDTEEFPMPGKLRAHAKQVINRLYDAGHCIIINTCRCDGDELLVENFLKNHHIKYCHINKNCDVKIWEFGNDTRKLAGHIHIDDRNIECLYANGGIGVDWFKIDNMLQSILHYRNFDHTKCDKRLKECGGITC